MKIDKTKPALEILHKNLIDNLSITGFIENGYANEIIIEGNSVLVKGISDQTWNYLSGKDENEIRKLIQISARGEKHFGAIPNWMIPIITEGKKIDWIITALQLHLPPDKQMPTNKIKVSKISLDDCGWMMENSKYQDILSINYLKDRINKSFSAGIYIEDKLIAWGITHDEGAIGALNVIENFRHLGYGTEIIINLVKQFRIKNKIPFAQVEEENKAAMNLFSKLGFVIDNEVSWLKLV